MTRRRWVLLAVVASACSRRPQAGPQLLPRTVAGVWQLKEMKEVRPEVPGVRRVVSATYDGPGSINVDVYETGSAAGGLDMVQKWRPAANTVVFYKNQYFAAVRWAQADRRALQDFLRALEKNLGEPR